MSGRIVLGWLSALLVGLLARAGAAEQLPSQEALMAEVRALRDKVAQVDALQAEIAQIRAQQSENWLNQRRAEEVKALVREVLADADTRASLLGGAAVAGHNGKAFFLASDDGTFLMNIGGQIQFRYTATFRDRGADPDGANDPATQATENPLLADDGEAGFTLHRVKFWFTGNIGNPKLAYRLVLASSRDTGAVYVEEASISYDLIPGLTLTGGRFKAPFTREYMTSTTRNFANECSYVDSQFAATYTEGLLATWKPVEMVRVLASFNDGAAAGDSSTTKDFYKDMTDYALTARVDLKLAGDWKQWDDFQAWSGEHLALFIGGAVHFEQAETGDANANTKELRWLADAALEAGGFNVYGAVLGRHRWMDNNTNQDFLGVVIQGGYMVIPDTLEPFVRWEHYDPNTGPEVELVTVGCNYYLIKHNAKLTVDVVWAMDPIPANKDTIGLLVDGSGRDNQVVVRAGFQLLF